MNTSRIRSHAALAATCCLLALSSACSGHSQNGSMLPTTASSTTTQGASAAQNGTQPDASILKMLPTQRIIGSTVDPKFHSQNPYGLSVAPGSGGGLTKGDLVVCNFNSETNVQGTGFTI